MILKSARRIVVFALLLLPLFVDMGCKKQARCGCGKDVVQTLTREPVNVYFSVEDNTVSFVPLANSSATYYLCNPSEWVEYLSGFTSPAMLLVSGKAYWECNYLYNSSNYSYYQPLYRVYQIDVTAMEEDLYGKK
ncbi:MAG: hypothetical protein RBS37_07415 [Bacteroidales bacterium]|nr:hypothetical protein [Bacteroidales bacterium]